MLLVLAGCATTPKAQLRPRATLTSSAPTAAPATRGPLPPGTKRAPTPPELDPRVLPTIDTLPPPAGWASTIAEPSDAVIARSTWTLACPVQRVDLRYVTVTFVGFDDKFHTGELLVHRTAAEPLTRVFKQLFDARFPIEQMRITTVAERDAAPAGDGNNTESYVCRPTVGSKRWSEHAYGLAIDVNPFQNPYVKGEQVLPELATSYLERANRRPGMIARGDVVARAFAQIGWAWGGNFTSLKDWMHFSARGR